MTSSTPTRRYAVASQKGGAGKSGITASVATAVHLALVARWLQGTGPLQRTLVVDGDELGALSKYFGLKPSDRSFAALYDVLTERDGLTAKTVIHQDVLDIPGLDLLPSDSRARMLPEVLAPRKFREKRLALALSEVTDDYAYIMHDTPGNLGLITVNALYACEYVIVPINMQDDNSVIGADHLLQEILDMRNEGGVQLAVRALVRGRVDPTRKTNRDLDDDMAILLQAGVPIAETLVRERAEFHRSTRASMPLVLAKSRSDGATDLLNLTRELFPELRDSVPFGSEIRPLLRAARSRFGADEGQDVRMVA